MIRRSQEERNHLVELYHSSGVTQTKFAKQHGIKVSTLVFWLANERKKVSSETPPPFVQVQSTTRPVNEPMVSIHFGSVTLHINATSDYVAALVRSLAC